MAVTRHVFMIDFCVPLTVVLVTHLPSALGANADPGGLRNCKCLTASEIENALDTS